MGDYVAIGASVNLYSVDKIFIGTKVAISEYAYICGASHDIGYLDRPLTQSTISIHDHAWIASGAMVHPGTIVGTRTVVAARAVVRGELESWKVFAGNPAKIVKARIIKDGSIT